MEEKPQKYSITRVNIAQECEYKHFLKYVKKSYPTTKMSFFLVGLVVHKVIERFFKEGFDKAEVLSFDSLLREEMLNFVSEAAVGLLEEYVESCFGYMLSTKLLYEKKFKKPAKNITRTKLWKEKTIPLIRAYELTINEQIANEDSNVIWYSTPTSVYCTIYKCLSTFLDFFRDDLTVTEATEHEYEIPVMDLFGFKVMGVIDRLTWQEFSFDILDYKTGKQRYTDASFEDDEQTCLYAYLVYLLTDCIPNKASVWDLLHAKQVSAEISFQQLQKFIERFKDKLEYAARLYEKQKGKKESELRFKLPDFSWQCKACEYAHSPKGCKYDKNKKENKT